MQFIHYIYVNSLNVSDFEEGQRKSGPAAKKTPAATTPAATEPAEKPSVKGKGQGKGKSATAKPVSDPEDGNYISSHQFHNVRY